MVVFLSFACVTMLCQPVSFGGLLCVTLLNAILFVSELLRSYHVLARITRSIRLCGIATWWRDAICIHESDVSQQPWKVRSMFLWGTLGFAPRGKVLFPDPRSLDCGHMICFDCSQEPGKLLDCDLSHFLAYAITALALWLGQLLNPRSILVYC